MKTPYDERFELFKKVFKFIEEKIDIFTVLTEEDVKEYFKNIKFPRGITFEQLKNFIFELAHGDRYTWNHLRDITVETDFYKKIVRFHQKLIEMKKDLTRRSLGCHKNN